MEQRCWNAQQQMAIDARGSSVVVSAAAGSGKTSVLTERVLRLIEEGEDIESMLIVTFTNLAASEMRERIYKRLQEASHGSARLAAQAEKCAFADISTLHAFCGRLIRDHFAQAGVSPAFAIADETQTGRLIQAAMEQTLECAMDDEKLYPFVQKYAQRGDTEPIKRIVLAIYTRAVSLKDPFAWLLQSRSHYNGGPFIDVLFDAFTGMVREAALMAQSHLQARTDIWQLRGFAEQARYSADDCDAFMRCSQQIDRQNVCIPMAEQIGIKAKGAPNRESTTLTNRANRCMDKLRAYAGDFCAITASQLAQTAPDGCFFIDLTKAFMKNYAKLKRAKNLLDHDDTMHFARKALDHADVAARYQSRYAHVFVDEYQDINEAQHAIITRLQRGDNDFLVGDVKQCIYTFRESNPKLLIRRCRELSGNGLIEMNTNYRSAPTIVEFINGVMRHMMSADAGGVEYTGGQVLSAGACATGRVSIVLAGREEEDNLSAECAELIEQIKKLLEQGYSYNQIAILRPEMRGSGRQIAAALADAGIPAVNGFGAAQADHGELAVFKNLLKLIAQNEDDIALASVMRYPYFGFTEPELSAIRLAQSSAPADKSFCHAVYMFESPSPLGDKVRAFLGTIARFKRLCACMKIPDFLYWLREEIRLRDYALTSPAGEGSDAAISGFISTVAVQSPITLFDVLAVSDRLCATREVQQSPKDADGVYLTTVHKSKGLEFPAVILSGLHKVIDQRDTKGSVLVGRSLGLALDVMDEQTHTRQRTLHSMAVARGLAREKTSETVRLLYVGMTRAIERLIMVGAGSRIKEDWCEPKPKGWQHGAYRYFDLLMPAVFMACRENGSDLADTVQIAQQSGEETATPIDKAQRLNSLLIKAEAMPPAEIFTGYAHQEALGVPSKVSVSALKRMEETAVLRPVDMAAQTEGITAAQRGTLTHRVLERIGLGQKTAEEVRAAIVQLERGGIIEKGAQAHVNAASISAFLCGELAARARQSAKCLVEQPFCLQMTAAECGLKDDSQEMVVVQGVIDLCFLEEGKWVIVDYKTDAVSFERAHHAAQKYAVQLKLYSAALERITGLSVSEKHVYYLSACAAVRLG